MSKAKVVHKTDKEEKPATSFGVYYSDGKSLLLVKRKKEIAKGQYTAKTGKYTTLFTFAHEDKKHALTIYPNTFLTANGITVQFLPKHKEKHKTKSKKKKEIPTTMI